VLKKEKKIYCIFICKQVGNKKLKRKKNKNPEVLTTRISQPSSTTMPPCQLLKM